MIAASALTSSPVSGPAGKGEGILPAVHPKVSPHLRGSDLVPCPSPSQSLARGLVKP